MDARPAERLIESWRLRAATYRRYAPGVAEAIDTCAAELTDAIADDVEEWVTLKNAAKMCGYSYSQLYRMGRSGRLTRRRSGQVTQVRVRDLPAKRGRKR